MYNYDRAIDRALTEEDDRQNALREEEVLQEELEAAAALHTAQQSLDALMNVEALEVIVEFLKARRIKTFHKDKVTIEVNYDGE